MFPSESERLFLLSFSFLFLFRFLPKKQLRAGFQSKSGRYILQFCFLISVSNLNLFPIPSISSANLPSKPSFFLLFESSRRFLSPLKPRNVEQKCVGLDHMYVFAAGEFSSRALSLDWNSSFSESLDRHNRFSPFPFSTFAFGFFHLASSF